MRILIDNPGHTFSRNLDAKFASAVKDLLRQGQDVDVQQFLRETMEWMETERSWDEDLAIMLQMWKKEKDRYQKVHKSLVRMEPGLPCLFCCLPLTWFALSIELPTAATSARTQPKFLWIAGWCSSACQCWFVVHVAAARGAVCSHL